MTGQHETRAIIVPSIGVRSWRDDVVRLAQDYANRCGADLVVETEAPDMDAFPLPEMPDSPGRSHKRLYACKSYFAWKHLTGDYGKVLVIDDTCCISPDAPDIFARTPAGHVGYTTTGAADARRSFADIRRYVTRNGLPEIVYDEDLYMNSGVMVYDRAAAAALSPDAIVAARSLLTSRFPHQSLSYYLLRAADLPMHRLDKKFNVVPAVGLDKEVRRDMTDIRAYVKPGVFIHHVTGMYRRRDLLIPQVCEVLEDQDVSTGT